MAVVLAPITISGTSPIPVPIQIDPGQLLAIKITNASPYQLIVSGLPNAANDSLSAFTEMRYVADSFNFGRLTLQPGIVLAAVGTVSVAIVTYYLVGDSLPAGVWPIQLSPAAVSGTLNANITGGSVGITGTPAVSVSGTPSVNVSNSPNINIVNPIATPGNVYNVQKYQAGGTYKGSLTGLTYQLYNAAYQTIYYLEDFDRLPTTSVSSYSYKPTLGPSYNPTVTGTVDLVSPSIASNKSGYLYAANDGSSATLLELADSAYLSSGIFAMTVGGGSSGASNNYLAMYIDPNIYIYYNTGSTYSMMLYIGGTTYDMTPNEPTPFVVAMIWSVTGTTITIYVYFTSSSLAGLYIPAHGNLGSYTIPYTAGMLTYRALQIQGLTSGSTEYMYPGGTTASTGQPIRVPAMILTP